VKYCERLWKALKGLKDWKFVKVCESLWKVVKDWKSVKGCEILWKALKGLKVCESLWKTVKVCESLCKVVEDWKAVKYCERLWKALKGLKDCGSLWKTVTDWKAVKGCENLKRPEYSPQHPILKHPQTTSLPQCEQSKLKLFSCEEKCLNIDQVTTAVRADWRPNTTNTKAHRCAPSVG
jgi:hypothetical protein